MSRTAVAVKKYVVELSAEERGSCEAFIGKGKRAAQLITKARILLKADVSEAGEGWNDSKIAGALDTSVDTVQRTRRQLVEEGFEAVLTRKYNPACAHLKVFDGAAEAKLIALACGPGRKSGASPIGWRNAASNPQTSSHAHFGDGPTKPPRGEPTLASIRQHLGS